MKLPVEPLPPAEPAEDLYAIRRRQPVPAAARVAPRTLPPLVIPPRHAHIPEEESAEARDAHLPEESEKRREGEERRQVCRRISNAPVLLDTRSGDDRRHRARREDDPIIGVDKEV